MYYILFGCLLDLLIGDPHNPFHPVRLIAALACAIEAVTRKLCGRFLKAAGVITWVAAAGISFGLAFLFLRLASFHPISRFLAEGTLVYFCISPRGLFDEARRVNSALQEQDLLTARKRLSMIVGRDTDALNETEIRRAVIETVAENFSDGVAAPLLFIAVGGPACGILYKAVNTMDSLFGYRDRKYRDFGWFPARMDDFFNLIPARISAFLIIPAAFFCGLSGRNAARIWCRDRYCHLSPNSAHPEAAFAGALGITMGGTHTYGGIPVEKPTIGDNRRPVDERRLNESLWLLTVSTLLCVLFSCGLHICIY